MARDLSIELRRFLVTLLRDPGSATAAVLGAAKDHVFGEEQPERQAWPFVRVELPTAFPDYDGCSDASRYTFQISGFAAGGDAGAVAPLANAILTDLEGLEGDLIANPAAHLQDVGWTSTQYMRDTARADGWHSAVSFGANVAG